MKKDELKRLLESKTIMDPVTGCWVWQNSGFRIMYNYKRYTPTHLAYKLYIGHKPEGASVFHTCKNNLCVNPDHLYIAGSERECAYKSIERRDMRIARLLIKAIHEKYGLTEKRMDMLLQAVIARELQGITKEDLTNGETSI